MQFIKTVNYNTDTLQEQELFDTVEGNFLDSLMNIFNDLDDLEEDPENRGELIPAISCIDKMIYKAAGENWEDLQGEKITEDPEEAANVFCEYLKKWILKIPDFTDKA